MTIEDMLKEINKITREKIGSTMKIENGVLVKYIGEEEIVNIPDNVVKIGIGAFSNCKSIKIVNIPAAQIK